MSAREQLSHVRTAVGSPERLNSQLTCGGSQELVVRSGASGAEGFAQEDIDCAVELPPNRRLMAYLSTGTRLGLRNVGRVVIYRACKRLGIYRWLLPLRKTV